MRLLPREPNFCRIFRNRFEAAYQASNAPAGGMPAGSSRRAFIINRLENESDLTGRAPIADVPRNLAARNG